MPRESQNSEPCRKFELCYVCKAGNLSLFKHASEQSIGRGTIPLSLYFIVEKRGKKMKTFFFHHSVVVYRLTGGGVDTLGEYEMRWNFLSICLLKWSIVFSNRFRRHCTFHSSPSASVSPFLSHFESLNNYYCYY